MFNWRKRYRKKINKISLEELEREYERTDRKVKQWQSEAYREWVSIRITGVLMMIGYLMLYGFLYIIGVSHQTLLGKCVLTFITLGFLFLLWSYLRVYYERKSKL